MDQSTIKAVFLLAEFSAEIKELQAADKEAPVPDQVMIETRVAQEKERFEADMKIMQERHVIEIERLQTLLNQVQGTHMRSYTCSTCSHIV